MSPELLMLFTFLAVVLAIAGTYSILSDLFLRDRSRVSKRVDEEFHKRTRDRAQAASALFKDFAAAPAEAGEEGNPTLGERFEALVEQSGLNLTPQRLLIIMAASAVVVGLLAGLLLQSLLAVAALT